MYFNFEMQIYCLQLEVDKRFDLEIFDNNLMHKSDKLGRWFKFKTKLYPVM
jgi:hypothetical protein